MGQVLRDGGRARQLALQDEWGTPGVAAGARRPASPDPSLCAGCRVREARYGFRSQEEGDPLLDRPRTLCFACFRMEMTRRQSIAERLARGWNARQVSLPLERELEALARRRRRAQIAARHAIERDPGTSRPRRER